MSGEAAPPHRTTLVNGLKYLVFGVVLRHMSPELFGNPPTALMTGGELTTVCHGLLWGFIVVVSVDSFASPAAKAVWVHDEAMRWLNKAAMFQSAGTSKGT